MIFGQDLSWTRDISALGLLGILLVIIFFVLVPKGWDFHVNSVTKKFDSIIKNISLAVKIGLRNYRMLRHILRHQHEDMRKRGINCEHDENSGDEELLEEDVEDGSDT